MSNSKDRKRKAEEEAPMEGELTLESVLELCDRAMKFDGSNLTKKARTAARHKLGQLCFYSVFAIDNQDECSIRRTHLSAEKALEHAREIELIPGYRAIVNEFKLDFNDAFCIEKLYSHLSLAKLSKLLPVEANKCLKIVVIVPFEFTCRKTSILVKGITEDEARSELKKATDGLHLLFSIYHETYASGVTVHEGAQNMIKAIRAQVNSVGGNWPVQ